MNTLRWVKTLTEQEVVPREEIFTAIRNMKGKQDKPGLDIFSEEKKKS